MKVSKEKYLDHLVQLNSALIGGLAASSDRGALDYYLDDPNPTIVYIAKLYNSLLLNVELNHEIEVVAEEIVNKHSEEANCKQ